MKPDRTAIYARVSTDEQTVENQLHECRRMAEFRGWTVADEYTDRGVSGSRQTRPELERLMQDVRTGKIDRVLVWKFDRFGRNTVHLVTAVDELSRLGVDFVSMTENFDTSTPTGRMMVTVLAAMAQLERDVLIERTKVGIARARREGKQIGAKKSCTPGEVARAYAELGSVRKVAVRLKVGVGSVGRRLVEARALGLLEERPTDAP